MVFIAPLVTFVSLSLSTLVSLASAAAVQKPLLQLPADAVQNRQTVKDMFLYTYDAYKSVHFGGAVLTEILIVTVAGSTRGVMMT